MNTWKTVIVGGTLGLTWSLVPLFCSELYRDAGEAASTFVAGIITGVALTLAIAPFIQRGKWQTFAIGLITLPLGAFIFGIVISYTHLAIKATTGQAYRFIEYGFRPLESGITYAGYSTCTFFALVLIPLALLTTYAAQRLTRCCPT